MRKLRRQWGWRVPVLLALFLIVVLTAKAAVNLLQTDAATAFKAGDYEKAATEFAVLVSENPEDVTLLRYLGITLRKLERYKDALTIFQKALTLAPDNVAVNYHIGVTLYKAGAMQAAVQSFRTVTTIDPDSKYAGLANQYMDAISDELARLQRPAAPKLFGFYGQVGVQYDSNISATPDNRAALVGDSSDTRFSGYLSGQYFVVNKDGWLVTLDVSAYSAGYSEEQFKALDVNQLNPGISIQKTTQFGQVPVVNSVRYDYLDVDIDGDAYSESDVLTLLSRLTFSPNTGTRLSYRYANDTFENKGFDAAFSSRDADNHNVRALNTWYLNKRKIELDLGLGYTTNKADGVNFNYDGWQVEAAARFALPKEWWLDLGAAWTSDEYPDFAGPVQRETDIADFRVALRRWFKNKFLVNLNASWHDEDSSYDSLTYDRYSVGLDFSYAH